LHKFIGLLIFNPNVLIHNHINNMQTRPSWLDNLIFLIPLVGMLIATLFGITPAETGDTSTLLTDLLANLWVWGTSAVAAVRGVINSVRRWKQDKGLVVNGFKVYVQNPVGTRGV
jgi:hypothetical protein